MQGLGPPVLEDVVLNSTSGLNITTDNLTVTFNGSDPDNDTFKNITNWYVNGSSWTVLNMPFEGGSNGTLAEENGFTKDYSPFANDGNVSNATFDPQGGFDGFGAYTFDGNHSFIDLGSQDELINF